MHRRRDHQRQALGAPAPTQLLRHVLALDRVHQVRLEAGGAQRGQRLADGDQQHPPAPAGQRLELAVERWAGGGDHRRHPGEGAAQRLEARVRQQRGRVLDGELRPRVHHRDAGARHHVGGVLDPRLAAAGARALGGYPAPNALGCWIGRALGERHFLPGGATVAQSAVRLAAALGADPILLVGQDLAFTEGRVYARGSAYDMVGLRAREDGRLRVHRPGREEGAARAGRPGGRHQRRADPGRGLGRRAGADLACVRFLPRALPRHRRVGGAGRAGCAAGQLHRGRRAHSRPRAAALCRTARGAGPSGARLRRAHRPRLRRGAACGSGGAGASAGCRSSRAGGARA